MARPRNRPYPARRFGITMSNLYIRFLRDCSGSAGEEPIMIFAILALGAALAFSNLHSAITSAINNAADAIRRMSAMGIIDY